ncbi:MAG TPA: signal peptidase II [Actinomycetota bacterium]|nr:signal peptidase II [Actinomycetota bacterium]
MPDRSSPTVEPRPRPLRRRVIALYAVAGAVYAVDRITKVLAEAYLRDRAPVEVIPGVFQLRFTTNPGGAFGLFGGLTWLFVVVSVVVIAVVVLASRNVPTMATAVGLGLILAGAAGNLTDRLIRGPGLSGEVVDFLDLHVWPVFNVADSAIVTGAAILLLTGLRRERPVPR